MVCVSRVLIFNESMDKGLLAWIKDCLHGNVESMDKG
jgi:hypothetical protein